MIMNYDPSSDKNKNNNNINKINSIPKSSSTISSDEVLICIEKLRSQLPIQYPIPFFVHNNPLMYWEKYQFEEGITKAIILYENDLFIKSRFFHREIEDFLLPMVVSYFDQGLNRWNVDSNKHGLWNWFKKYVTTTLSLKSKIIPSLKKDLIQFSDKSNIEIINLVLYRKGLTQSQVENYIQYLLFLFKGWSGMINVFENKNEQYPLVAYPVSLLEWIAILVVTEHNISISHQTKLLNNDTKISIRKKIISSEIKKIKKNEIEYYQKVIFQIKNQLQLKNSNLHDKNPPSKNQNLITDTVFLFCIDDREESLRRHLEKQNSKYHTHGTVGFFGLDFKLKRPHHVIHQPQCPPVILANKTAVEKSPPQFKNRKLYSVLPHFNESRFNFIEPILSLFAWPLFMAALTLRTLKPKIYSLLRNKIKPDPYIHSNTKIEFTNAYCDEEKANILFNILNGMGLVNITTDMVIVVGHGSTTTNNPFQKSYGCGACSGQSGYANSKVFCDFANDHKIRELVILKGISFNSNTVFIPACHDTAADEIDIFENDNLTELQKNKLTLIKNDLYLALEENKKERIQQFQLPKTTDFKSRSLDWSQPRPEFGHSLVSCAVFGPRQMTKNLHLERRSFLISYDPTTDHDGAALEFSIMNALPVCANINMDYFTSKAFPEAFGAGSKLPLNIASGIGLMAGSKGDLKIGLALQMVDYHLPLRLISFVYAEKSKLNQVISKSARLQNIINNHWIHLIRIDPLTHQFESYSQELKNEFAFVR